MNNNIIETWHPKLKGELWKIIKYDGELGFFNCFSFAIDIYDEWSGAKYRKLDH